MTIAEVRLQPVTRGSLRAAGAAQQDALFSVEWTDTHLPSAGARAPETWAVVGDDTLGIRAGLMKAGQYAEAYPDLEALAAAVGDGSAPDVVVTAATGTPGAERAAAVHDTTRRALDRARTWVTTPLFERSRLVFLTRGAVPAWQDNAPDGSLDPTAAAVWVLVRSAQTEFPGRFLLVDTDAGKPAWRALLRAAGS
ncbi:SpnB-like Rossmann fold domain-containing protein, partial [Streptomyces sparsus]